MNHTLKSLLITSVLIIPSVFGAACPPDSSDDDDKEFRAENRAAESSVVTRSGITTTESTSSGYPAAEAASSSPETSSQFQPGHLHDEPSPQSTALVPRGRAMAATAGTEAPLPPLLRMSIELFSLIQGNVIKTGDSQGEGDSQGKIKRG